MEVKYIDLQRVEVVFDDIDELVTIHGFDNDGKVHSIGVGRNQFFDVVAQSFEAFSLIGTEASKRGGTIFASANVDPSNVP